jgi:hypothetical protein
MQQKKTIADDYKEDVTVAAGGIAARRAKGYRDRERQFVVHAPVNFYP